MLPHICYNHVSDFFSFKGENRIHGSVTSEQTLKMSNRIAGEFVVLFLGR